jgi:hypothetical protein
MISLAFLIIAVLFVLAASIQGFALLWIFVDAQSLLFVLLGIAGYFLLFGRKEFRRGVKTFFAFSFPPDEHDLESGQFFLRLSSFTMRWGILGMLLGVIMIMTDLNPDTVGHALAISLLSFLYASGLALFVFLPIGLRLSPPMVQPPGFWRFSVWHLLFALVAFYLLRCLAAFMMLAVSHDPAESFGVVFQQAAFTINPADPQGNYSPFGYGIFLYIDPVSIVLMVAGWWTFRLASGKRRRWIAAPVVILIGIFWSIQGFVFMLANLNPDTICAGFMVLTLTTLYGFIAAIGFLIVDSIKSGNDKTPSSPALSDETEQAKQIIDRVVEKERR